MIIDVVINTTLHRVHLFLTTTLGGWFAAAFTHAVFDILAAGFAFCTSACLTHTITPFVE